MARYKPPERFNVPLVLLAPTYTKVLGVEKKTFPSLQQGVLFYGSFRSFGGTEREMNGVYSVEDTAIVECWYRPDIKADCRIGVLSSGAIYEILGEPENINMENQYLKFRVQRYKGGA